MSEVENNELAVATTGFTALANNNLLEEAMTDGRKRLRPMLIGRNIQRRHLAGGAIFRTLIPMIGENGRLQSAAP